MEKKGILADKLTTKKNSLYSLIVVRRGLELMALIDEFS